VETTGDFPLATRLPGGVSIASLQDGHNAKRPPSRALQNPRQSWTHQWLAGSRTCNSCTRVPGCTKQRTEAARPMVVADYGVCTSFQCHAPVVQAGGTQWHLT
jgi:hypothetical protein